jgi:hypothetical protein
MGSSAGRLSRISLMVFISESGEAAGQARLRGAGEFVRPVRALCAEVADDDRRPMRRENGSRARPPVIRTFFSIEEKGRASTDVHSTAGARNYSVCK